MVTVLLQVVGGRNAGQEIAVRGRRFLIGRAKDCHLRAHSELISRYHCALHIEEEGIFVRDYGSRNGAFLDGKRILGQAELRDGQRLQIGPLEFVVRIRREPSSGAGKDTLLRASETDTMHATTGKSKSSLAKKPRQKSGKEVSAADAARMVHDVPDPVDVMNFLAEPGPEGSSKHPRGDATLPSLDEFLAVERAAAEAKQAPESASSDDASNAAVDGLKKFFTPKHR